MVSVHGVSVLGYGAYVPLLRIMGSEIAKLWGRGSGGLPAREKSLAGLDEDTTTMAVEAARFALLRAEVSAVGVGAVLVGTESKPYAVKPTGTVVAEAIGSSTDLLSADYEFACKAGTEAIQTGLALVEAGKVQHALAIGSDTAQGRPRDELEYTAASGAAAFLLGRKGPDAIATYEASVSFVTDTPDFFRRSYRRYPSHMGRFTGAPAYFRHTLTAARRIMDETGYGVEDFDFAVFHQPNVKFPIVAARSLGFPISKVKPGVLVNDIGNTYAASSLLGLASILDVAEPGQRILHVSFGSGAGSDAFVLRVNKGIEDKRNLAPLVSQLVGRRSYVDYAFYARCRGKIQS